MPPSPVDRMKQRLAALADSGPEAVEVIMRHGPVKNAHLYERNVELAEVRDPACAKNASELLAAIGADSNLETESKLTGIFTRLKDAKEPDGGWTTIDDLSDLANSGMARARVKSYCTLLMKIEEQDSRRVAEAARLSPTTVPNSSAPTADGVDKTIVIKGNKEREEERLGVMGGWLAIHVPPPATWPAQVEPHRELMLAFDSWKVATAPPSIPQLKTLVKKGRAQTVIAGRESYLLDLLTVMLALRKCYSLPMPVGYKQDKRYDRSLLEWDVYDPSDPTVATKERRPAQLSASVVDDAILVIIVALAPLSDQEQERLAESMWNSFMTQMGCLNGHTMSKAVVLTWGAESTPISTAMSTLRGQAARQEQTPRRVSYVEVDDRDRDRDRGSKGGGRDRGSPGKGAAKTIRKPTSEERKARANCDRWERTGKCADHYAGKCKERNHPQKWANVGRATYDDEA